MRHRIFCTTPDHHHERIASIGCVDEAGTKRTFTEAEAIGLIESNRASFYVERPDGHRVEVMVEKSPEGHKFLKTEADGEKPNNLRSLPRCKIEPPVNVPPRTFAPARSHGCVQW